MLSYSREATASLLSGFECGIPLMDEFIRDQLDVFLTNNSHYSLYVIRDGGYEVVAFFVISAGIFVDCEEEYLDLPYGKPWGYMDQNFQLHTALMYPTMEIDYLAVRKDRQNRGIGRYIISEIVRKLADEKGLYFLTVEAYHDSSYSAVPFYEKLGFFALQEYSDDSNTLRMAMRIVSD